MGISAEMQDAILIRGEVEVIKHEAATCTCTAERMGEHCVETFRQKIRNVFTSAGKAAIARRLVADETTAMSATGATASRAGIANVIAVGTGAGTPAVSDVAMFTETLRLTVSAPPTGSSFSGNVATIKVFFNSSQANVAMTEAGLFGDITAADAPGSVASPGTMYAHTGLSVTKSSGETMTILWTITVG